MGTVNIHSTLKDKKNLNISFFHIIFIMNLIITGMWELAKNNPALMSILESHFTLSLSNIQNLKLWCVFTYSFSHRTFLDFSLTMFPMIFMILKLTNFYSYRELGRFYIYAALTGGLAHLFVSPYTLAINGAFGIFLAYLILYCQFCNEDPLIRFFKITLTTKTFTLFLILLDLFTIYSHYRIDRGSFANHIGIFIFCYFYIKKDRKKNETFDIPVRKVYRPVQKSAPVSEKKSPEPQVDEILDKISRYGINSLTEKERMILDNESRKSKNK